MQQTHMSVTNSHSGIMSVPEYCVDVARLWSPHRSVCRTNLPQNTLSVFIQHDDIL